jgi:hypothetical protein
MVLSENIFINPEKTVIKPATPKSAGDKSLEIIMLERKVISCDAYVKLPLIARFLKKLFLKLNSIEITLKMLFDL